MSTPEAHSISKSFEKKPLLEQYLHDIVSDRTHTNTALLSEHIRTSTYMPEHVSESVTCALTILHHMNGQRGHALRVTMRQYTNPIAVYMQQIYDWSVRFAAGDATLAEIDQYRIPADIHTICTHDAFDDTVLLTAVVTGTCAEVHSMVDTKEITESSLATLLLTTGTIPLNLVTQNTVKHIETHLRTLETRDALKVVAKRARATVLNYMFESGITDGMRSTKQKNVTLDSRGLFISFQHMHAHIPLALVTQQCLAALREKQWISDSDAQEIAVRQCRENNYLETYQVATEEQFALFQQEFLKYTGKRFDEMYIRTIVYEHPATFAEILHTHQLVIPDTVIAMILQIHPQKGYVALLSVAQSISGYVAQYNFQEAYHQLQPVVRGVLKKEYDAYEKALLQPAYYTASKITRTLLANPLVSNPAEKYLVFQGVFGKEGHHFLEAVHDGNMARILFEDSLQTPVATIPTIEQPIYERFEARLRALQAVRVTLSRITQAIGSGRFELITQTDVQAVQTFLLTNTTAYKSAEAVYQVIQKKGNDSALWNQFALVCSDAIDVYESVMYTQFDEEPTVEPEYVTTKKIEYGPGYLAEIRQVTTPRHFDEVLCAASVTVPVALIESGPLSTTVPFASEEVALDAIRLNRNKPLINVIGGAKQMDTTVYGPLQQIAEAVLMVAHEYKANVAVPGTQSGMGTVFGHAYLMYQNIFGSLPLKDQARMFSIISGGDVYFPGNPYVRSDRHPYGLVPVPSLVTRHSAEWERKGYAKRSSPYYTQIAHMESLYKRMCAGKHVDSTQPRIALVGNGGLYSLWELEKIIDDDFDVMLIRGSGRLADVISYLMEHAPADIDWSSSDTDMLAEMVIEILSTASGDVYLDDAVRREFFEKDFGSKITLGNLETDEEQQNYDVYRTSFFGFLSRAMQYRDRVHTTTVETVADDLRALF